MKRRKMQMEDFAAFVDWRIESVRRREERREREVEKEEKERQWGDSMEVGSKQGFLVGLAKTGCRTLSVAPIEVSCCEEIDPELPTHQRIPPSLQALHLESLYFACFYDLV